MAERMTLADMQTWTIEQRGEPGPWRASLKEAGIESVVAYGATPEEALKQGKAIDRKARKGGGR